MSVRSNTATEATSTTTVSKPSMKAALIALTALVVVPVAVGLGLVVYWHRLPASSATRSTPSSTTCLTEPKTQSKGRLSAHRIGPTG